MQYILILNVKDCGFKGMLPADTYLFMLTKAGMISIILMQQAVNDAGY